jgi:ectoine hydroxylase-related dioxygenase (phytanoyl-CoA dioxygenase family)
MRERYSPKENEVKFRLGDELPEDARAFYDEHGFVVFENVFSGRELDRMLAAVDEAAGAIPPGHHDLTLGLAPDGRPRAGRLYFLARHAPEIFDLVSGDPRMLALSTLCPGQRNLLTQHSAGVLYQDKWPTPSSGFRGLRWHDDADTQGYGHLLTVGIYFDRSTQANGALRVLPGTHRNRDVAIPAEADLHPDDGLWHCSPMGWERDPVLGRRRVIYAAWTAAVPADAPEWAAPGYRQKVDL